jgi:tetratricopeptide (TPR) repeat protein/predicted Ser/Thr protein kinase
MMADSIRYPLSSLDQKPVPVDDVRVSHYRLMERLGGGGMGEVYAALDETLTRRVALKAIRPEHRLSADSKTRFLREAQILSQLDHPNICRVYDYFEERGRDWLVLELVEGQDLRVAASRLDRTARIAVAEQIAAVLVVTHANGVVHRDLKPGNVMISRAGGVKVLDFGLARSALLPAPALLTGPSVLEALQPGDLDTTRFAPLVVHESLSASDGAPTQFQTRHGAITGTAGYMSPEQARGEPAMAASDMYAFGLLLQELFTGRRPYDESLPYETLLERARRGESLPVQGIPADLARLIERLKSRAASERPTAHDAADRLQWIRNKPKRRLRRLVGAAVVAAAALGAIKYTIDLARERSVAVAAREDAERRRQQAETLIGFMLGNLRGKLQQAGRLELLEDVGREATAYFKSTPPGSMTGEELFRRSQALYQIGQIRQAEGKLKDAADAYRESLAVAEQVATRDPSNAEWRLGLATAHFYVGEILRVQGDSSGAMREYAAYRDIAQRLSARDPANERWALEVSYSNGAVAAIQELQGDLQGARQQLESALAIKEALAAKKPDDPERQRAVAVGHNRLGVVLDKLGEADAALKHYIADLAVMQSLSQSRPKDASIRPRIQVALNRVGLACEERGDLTAAVRYYRAWRDEAAAYAATDPRNADWQRDVAVATSYLAGALRLAGELPRALSGYREAVGVLSPIARASPTSAPRQRDLAVAELGFGRTSLDAGSTEDAIRSAERVERLLAPLPISSGDLDATRIGAEAKLLLADAVARLGDRARAKTLRQAAVEQLAAKLGVSDTRTLAITARALLALKRDAQARSIVDWLTARGYRHPMLARAMKQRLD